MLKYLRYLATPILVSISIYFAAMGKEWIWIYLIGFNIFVIDSRENFISKINNALISRCAKYRFKSLSKQTIYKCLKNISKKENFIIPPRITPTVRIKIPPAMHRKDKGISTALRSRGL